MNPTDLFAAVLMGLVGSGHCLAMCGGLAGAMGMQQRSSRLLIYNAGRITSYMLAGAVIGGALWGVTQIDARSLIMLRIFAGVMMILLAFYLIQYRRTLLWLERIGGVLWRKLQPLQRHINRQGTGGHVYLAGMLWGWLPCGLVYSALSWAALSADPINGALLMLFFGIGTLPSMLLIGVASQRFNNVLQSKGFRWLSAIILIVFGLSTIVIGLLQIT
ncbi:MAG: sulfite exporter TauE/SafE family protein [Idiomarina sp.]|nr:sulfite exporter TauE/SafE family protein [Idiomarina sp.]